MRIAVAGDHNGFTMKNDIVSYLLEAGHDVVNIGPKDPDPQDDYPDHALAVAKAIISGEVERGILVCGSGVGASVAANKVTGIRASVCHDTYSAHQGVEHDDMNVLCLGARIVGLETAREAVNAFVSSNFTKEERHQRRLEKVRAIERTSGQDETS